MLHLRSLPASMPSLGRLILLLAYAGGMGASPASADSPSAFQSDSGSPSGDVAERITSLMHFDSVMPNEDDALDQGLSEQQMRESSDFPRARPKSSPAGHSPSRSPTHPTSVSTAHSHRPSAEPPSSSAGISQMPTDSSRPLPSPSTHQQWPCPVKSHSEACSPGYS